MTGDDDLLSALSSDSVKSGGGYYQTKPLLNAHLKNPLEDLTQIEVTDVMHPLFGRRFAVVSLSNPPSSAGHVVVAYRGYMRLRIPVSAIQQVPPQGYLSTKLTLESVTELVTLAKQCEVLCQSNPMKSGAASRRPSKKQSSKNSKPSPLEIIYEYIRTGDTSTSKTQSDNLHPSIYAAPITQQSGESSSTICPTPTGN